MNLGMSLLPSDVLVFVFLLDSFVIESMMKHWNWYKPLWFLFLFRLICFACFLFVLVCLSLCVCVVVCMFFNLHSL